MAPAAARRAAITAVRYVASTARSTVAAAPPRAAVIHHASSSVAAGSAATPSSAVAIRHASSSVAAGSAATPPSAVAIHLSSSSSVAATGITPARNIATAGRLTRATPYRFKVHRRFRHHLASSVAGTGIAPPAAPHTRATRYTFKGHRRFKHHLASPSGRLTRATTYPFKVHRRFKHSQKSDIPDEVWSELKRIEAEGMRKHKELQQSILVLTKQVAERSANAKATKVDATWQMGKTAMTVCSIVLSTAAISGYTVLQFVRFGWGKDSRDAAGVMLESKVSELKEELEAYMDTILKQKEEDEAMALVQKKLALDEKALLLDKKEAELTAREAAVASKEAATKKPPKG